VGVPLEPLTAQDVGQAASKEGYRHKQKEEIEHVKSLPPNMVFATGSDQQSTLARNKSRGCQKKPLPHQDCVKIALPVVCLIHLGEVGPGKVGTTIALSLETFGRVLILVAVGIPVWTPTGVAIGFHPLAR